MIDKNIRCSYRFSLEDCLSLAEGIKASPKLKKFSLTRSNLDQPRVAAILQGMVSNDNVSQYISIMWITCKSHYFRLKINKNTTKDIFLLKAKTKAVIANIIICFNNFWQ